jgi:prepilin-type N-terminal cleavage/methylation domain-containing protein
MKKSKSGFTLVEILIVLIVIGILASLVIVSFNNIQARSRDARRISDVQNIADAIASYRAKYGGEISTSSGCGWQGNGSGWLNYDGVASYPKSILTCLTEKGYLTTSFIDPSGCTADVNQPASCKRPGYAYMKYTSGSGDTSVTCVYARLEQGSNIVDLTAANPCTSASSSMVATTYGMNYAVLVK